ncbi:hypothetical protein P7K49_009254 [Saguinus oedipus]|uniref:Uncharacterized protein n=1 Tax=Saguinus oedipus TaxID=9490 RepID=A0ABQ9VLR0_SAGOE|nr:hypothetical protein P7K49_009254 [Saguinus oedipus]
MKAAARPLASTSSRLVIPVREADLEPASLRGRRRYAPHSQLQDAALQALLQEYAQPGHRGNGAAPSRRMREVKGQPSEFRFRFRDLVCCQKSFVVSVSSQSTFLASVRGARCPEVRCYRHGGLYCGRETADSQSGQGRRSRGALWQVA